MIQAVVPQRQEVDETWSEHKTLDRYSDRLFAVILAIATADDGDSAVAQAAIVAQNEGAHLFVIQTAPVGEGGQGEAQMRSTRESFEMVLGEAGVSGEIRFEQDALFISDKKSNN